MLIILKYEINKSEISGGNREITKCKMQNTKCRRNAEINQNENRLKCKIKCGNTKYVRVE
jgi:hypothetical protein